MAPELASERQSTGRGSSGVVSIVLGLVGLPTALIEPTLALLLGIAGLGFGLARRARSPRLALAGIVINAVLLVMLVLIAANVFPPQ